MDWTCEEGLASANFKCSWKPGSDAVPELRLLVSHQNNPVRACRQFGPQRTGASDGSFPAIS